jgi:hypothetical protein
MTPAFCTNCGAKLTATSRFCPECGARLADLSLPMEAAAEPTAALPSQPTPPHSEPTAALPEQSASAVPPTLPLPGLAADTASQPPAPQRSNARLIIGALIVLGALFFGACIGLVLVTLNFASAQRERSPEVHMQETSVPIPAPAAPIAPGEVLLNETFDDPATSRFDTNATDISRFTFQDGGYQIEVREPEYISWQQLEEIYRDVVITVDTVFPPASQRAAAVLIFHYQDDDHFYLFSVTNDGAYALELQRDGRWDVLIDWTESPEIDAVRNTLRVTTQENRIGLYVNGVLLEETIDETFTAGGVGVAAMSFDETPAIVRFDTLVIARSR